LKKQPVWFRFYKSETEKTEPNRKKNPEKTEPNWFEPVFIKKIEPNETGWFEPVLIFF